MSRPRVAIVGGGFGGLQVARKLARVPVDITLIDRRNFHLFQPLLYQVATGGLSPANIATPLRGILAKQANVCVRKAEVVGFDLDLQRVVLTDGFAEFDYLILATGSSHSYFGNDAWRRVAPGLKTVEEALQIRRQIFEAFERAEYEVDAAERRALMTFVIVGGGPTGVELAGALSELAQHTLRDNFRNINTAESRIYLLEATDRLLTGYDPRLSQKAQRSLEKLGVDVRLRTMVQEIRDGCVEWAVDDSQGKIEAETILWAAGVQASPLGSELAQQADAEVDRKGRVKVNADLSVGEHENIFVIGDLALLEDEDGNALPGIAPVAMQQGKYVAKLIRGQLRGTPKEPFRYRDLGNMAVIGRAAAVAEIGRLRVHGLLAWLMWLFIHLINLVEFENRVLVLLQWSWNYITRNRSARLVTNEVNRQDLGETLAEGSAARDSEVAT